MAPPLFSTERAGPVLIQHHGFVESTGETTQTGGPRGGPRSRLYRRGDARLLHPALLRPGREDDIR